MTVTTAPRKAGPFIGNGTATTFPFSFKVFSAGELAIYHISATGVTTRLTSNFTVTLNADQDVNPGGTITYPNTGSPMTSSESLNVIGMLEYKQGTDITNASRFLAQVIEDALDYTTILTQQLLEKSGRSLTIPAGESVTTEFSLAASRAGKFAAFDAAGAVIASAGTGSDAGLRTDLAAATGSSLVGFTQPGASSAAATVQTELRRLVYAAHFLGANFGEKLANAIAFMPSAGGIIDCTDFTGSQTVSANIIVDKPVKIYLGAYTVALGTNQLLLTASGASIIGIAKSHENNSPSRFSYSGTSSGIKLQRSITATAMFGNVLSDFEISATGDAGTSATAVGIASHGTRYNEFRNISVFNFAQGKATYFTGNGAVVDGFGATNTIINPAFSTNKYGIFVDAVGGSASTHGLVYGGYIFGSTSALDTTSESWRFFGTDFGGTPGVKIRGGADDTVLTACRWEASSSEVVIDAGVFRTQIISPSIINHQGAGPEITDNGSHTVVIISSNNTDSKLRGLRAQTNYANKGVTASLAAGASADVLQMSPGGIWLVGVRQSDGGTAWRAAAIVFSSGPALVVASITSNNVTVTSNGSMLRLTNSHATDAITLAWSVIKFEGAALF